MHMDLEKIKALRPAIIVCDRADGDDAGVSFTVKARVDKQDVLVKETVIAFEMFAEEIFKEFEGLEIIDATTTERNLFRRMLAERKQ